MRSKLVIPALAIGISLAAALITPASAQYGPVYGPYFNGPTAYGGVVYGPRVFRGPYAVYYGEPAIGPFFYGDGWVPEPIFDHSRPGGIDPYIRPPS